MTKPLDVGTQKFKSIDIKGAPEKVVRVGFNVTGQIFGIPYKATDATDRKLKLQPIEAAVESYPFMDLFVGNKPVLRHEILIKFYFDFVQETLTKDYYTFQDILAEIGGLATIASGAIGSLAMLWTLIFMKGIAIHV